MAGVHEIPDELIAFANHSHIPLFQSTKLSVHLMWLIRHYLAKELAEAYRTYRQRMHHLNLAGAPGLVPRPEAAALVAAVIRHWQAVFYTDAPQSAE